MIAGPTKVTAASCNEVGPEVRLLPMTEPRKRNPELERMLENSRQAIRRSEELIAETKERLKKSGQLTERERQERPSWRP